MVNTFTTLFTYYECLYLQKNADIPNRFCVGLTPITGSSYLPTTTVNNRQQPSTTDNNRQQTDNKLKTTDNKIFKRYFQIKRDFNASLPLKRLYKG